MTRELLTNIVKHSHAQEVSLSIWQDDQFVRIAVEDDGIGCEYNIDSGSYEPDHDGFGLFSIRERLSMIDGYIRFHSRKNAGTRVEIGYIPPLGDGQGYMPLELLLMSLASCSGATVVTFLRKMKKNISGLKVNAKGTRRDQHPTSFQSITLEFVISSGDVQESDIDQAIKLSEETYCPVWAMLKNNVEIIPEFRIIKP